LPGALGAVTVVAKAPPPLDVTVVVDVGLATVMAELVLKYEPYTVIVAPGAKLV